MTKEDEFMFCLFAQGDGVKVVLRLNMSDAVMSGIGGMGGCRDIAPTPGTFFAGRQQV